MLYIPFILFQQFASFIYYASLVARSSFFFSVKQHFFEPNGLARFRCVIDNSFVLDFHTSFRANVSSRTSMTFETCHLRSLCLFEDFLSSNTCLSGTCFFQTISSSGTSNSQEYPLLKRYLNRILIFHFLILGNCIFRTKQSTTLLVVSITFHLILQEQSHELVYQQLEYVTWLFFSIFIYIPSD